MLKFSGGAAVALFCFFVGVAPASLAQPAFDEPEWAETQVPPPPAFDMKKLVAVDVPGSALAYGVDPASIQISKKDGIVRYVMVATSTSGARNVMYEGLRCSTGEFKTYSRYLPEGEWKPVTGAQWKSVFGNMPSKHALQFAKAGACEGATSASTVDGLVSRLKNPNNRTPN
jgi:CNP1-like family